MKTDNSISSGWNEWQCILAGLFEQRLSALFLKGGQPATAKRAFSALFLQVKGFATPGTGILAEALTLVRGQGADDPRYDPLAMWGHQFGLVENVSELRSYFGDLKTALAPQGKVLLTAIDTGTAAGSLFQEINPGNRSGGEMQFQHEKLIGPFFNLLCFKSEILKNQASTAGWRPQIIHHQDDSNYLVLLDIAGSG